ncbi:MAG: hypothetical protein HS109_18325 [Burkholderiales bacterium]|nr:hypothetical protein [Burkholderiales bacterium]
MRARLVLAFAAWVAWVPQAAAQGEHERRLAAELTILAGDVRLLDEAALPPLRMAGLRERIAGALSSLPLLLRRAGGDPGTVPVLRDGWARSDWRALRAALAVLRERHPFDAGALLPTRPTPAQRAVGAAIHREVCAGCHDAPAADTKLPALDLRAQAKRMPREEFAARLLLGVRGDRSTAYRNPFSDLELAALVAWYEDARPGDAAKK